MLTYPDIDPVLIALGPLKIHWYGVMYLVGFWGGWWLGRVRAKKPGSGWTVTQIDDLVFYIVVGVVLGGRLGYTLFYGFPRFIEDPVTLLKVWEGGMSFHGGLLGVLMAMWLFGRKYGRTFFESTDFIAPLIPIGLGAGRLGNFINGELWGGATRMPWGMQVPCVEVGDLCSRVGVAVDGIHSLPVHPNQLYEVLLEGVVLFLVLWLFSARARPRMAVSGLFLLCYGVFRFGVEFVRMPDLHLGYLAFDWVTMGQLLSLPMILFGILLLILAYRNRSTMNERRHETVS
ncbi:MAG: prolipoprotein diacylglyceryl transferase [gamma proteobacterium endosymbiont of Lamellibrachia anaximandri]|nr:prolipoprotein diacylglyceryl transferase [gamma proteobacterium endosymbiont of Lamellibrachia anaximandri]